MKAIVLLFTLMIGITCFLISPTGWADSPARIDLTTDWRLQSSREITKSGAALSMEGFDASAWYATAVPKTVLAALVDNEVYPDPYYGTNMKQIPGYKDDLWLVMPADSPFHDGWWFRNEFIVPESWKEKNITLHFDGINYAANIWLNGVQIAGQDTVRGMFRRFEFPVTDKLLYGRANAVAVEIFAPGLIEDKDYNTKQVEATVGWDDHNPQPPDRSMGIWQPVYLTAEGPLSLKNPYVETHLDIPSLDSATLTLSAVIRNNTSKPVEGTLEAAIENIALKQKVSLGPGESREYFFRPEEYPELTLQHPRVWWPHPLGPQELYDLSMTLTAGTAISDTAKVRFGIREISSSLNEEDWRYYQVNGKRVLIRGGAWMNSDMLFNLSHNRYEALVRYAREANLNMLRSEGFSIRETDDFYNLCDEMGIMVTQQLFGRSIADEPLAIACVEDTLSRIRNHPSLAHFLGHDETFPTENLDGAYRSLLEKYRLNRSYQPHSGTFSIQTRKKTGGTRTGTRELWTYAGPSHYYYTNRKFDVAWGFAQSGGIGGVLASRDSLRQMMPADQLWPAMRSEAWSFHTVTQGSDYFDAVIKAMEAGYGPATDLDDFCNKIYAMNYNSARGMFEAYGKNKYTATGITTWKYDAAWPAAMTWQYIDWYLRPTAAYYGAKKACTPLHAIYAYNDATVYVVNSFYQAYKDLKIKAAWYSLKGKSIGEGEERTIDIPEDAVVKAFEAAFPKEGSDPAFLKLTLTGADGALLSDNVYWISKTPDIPGASRERDGLFSVKPRSIADFTALAKMPRISLHPEVQEEKTAEETRLTVKIANDSPHIAFLVQLTARNKATGSEIGPVYWSDNFFTLLPGESKSVIGIIPQSALTEGSPEVTWTAFNAEK